MLNGLNVLPFSQLMPVNIFFRKMKKTEISRQIQVVHQIVSLTGINFTTKSIIGFVELTVIPLKVSFWSSLNIGRGRF